MIKTSASVWINRSQKEIFDYISDPANDSNWISGTQSSEWTSEGPHGVGSTQASVIRFLGRKIESTLEVTDWEPPNSYGFKVSEGPIPFQGVTRLESAGESGTEVTLSIEGEPGGFFKLAEGLVAKQLQKQVDTDLNALKLLLEAEED